MHAEAAAASDTLPAGHFVQVDDPSELLKNPGRQSTHSDARPPLDLPGGHSEHSCDAARLNDPALHSLHAEEPFTLANVPASHTGHSDSRFAPGEALPRLSLYPISQISIPLSLSSSRSTSRRRFPKRLREDFRLLLLAQRAVAPSLASLCCATCSSCASAAATKTTWRLLSRPRACCRCAAPSPHPHPATSPSRSAASGCGCGCGCGPG